jgi:valyl-tRNA synthetase
VLFADHSVTFDVNECHTNRLFCNKVWQAGKFVLSAVKQVGPCDLVLPNSTPSGLFEQWILSRQANAVQVVESALVQADMHEATAAIKVKNSYFFINT